MEKKITTVMFDLDGTLLPMDNDLFTKYYFGLLCKKMAPHGYEANELIDAIWSGTGAMVKNDGSVSNETAFWKRFEEVLGPRVKDARAVLEDFYTNEFTGAKAVCGYNEKLVQIVKWLKESGIRVVLATNPIFPSMATEHRIRWAGFQPEDFEIYTTYENIGLCKPNPEYYREILHRLNISAEEAVMVGNDVAEDMIAEELGMKVFLLKDFMLNKLNLDCSSYPQGNADDLDAFLKEIIK